MSFLILQLEIYLKTHQRKFQALQHKSCLSKLLREVSHYGLDQGQTTENLLTQGEKFNLKSPRHRISMLRFI